MDPTGQGGDPSGCGAYYNPAQFPDLPSPWQPLPEQATPPLQMNPQLQFEPHQGGYMDPNWQGGGNPSGRGAYYNPAQFPDLPSPWQPLPEQATPPLQMNPQLQFEPHQGGYMDPNWQGGGNPNGLSANYNYYNPAQRRDRDDPSSSSSRATPLQLFTSQPELQPEGGYMVNQSSSGAAIIPTRGRVPGYDFVLPDGAPWPWMPNGIGSQYPPHPGSGSVFNALNYGYNSNPNASVFQPGAPLYAPPGAATITAFSAWGGNANQGASRAPVPGVPNRYRMEILNFSARDLEGAIRRARTPGELVLIANRLVWNHNNGIPLMEVAQRMSGERALKDVVDSVSRYLGPGALQQLFRCLVDGWIMDQSNGPGLLRHFFNHLPYRWSSICVDEFALPRFSEMVRSSIGRTSMMACLDTEQPTAVHNTVVNQAVEIARDVHGSFLLRAIFERGCNGQLQECIRELVEQNLVELSMDPNGSMVVRPCFVPDPKSRMLPRYSERPLQRGLQAFLRLPGEQLQELVQNNHARCVLERLLQTSVNRALASAEAKQLAQRILGVVAAGYETAKLVSIAQRVIS